MGSLHEFPDLGADPEVDDRGLDVAFGFVLLVLWVCSAVRVSVAASDHEVFGAEASLAFVCLLGLPWLTVRSWLRKRAPAAVPRRPRAAGRSLRNRHLKVVVAPRPRD